MRSVQHALEDRFSSGRETLYTFGKHVAFEVEVDGAGLALYLGDQRTRTHLSWRCLEGGRAYLADRLGWVKVGGLKSNDAEPGTFDEYLKSHCTKTNVARWLAKALAEAAIVDALDEQPLVIRLRHDFR